MADRLYSTQQSDEDGRQYVTSDNIIDVHYYDAESESWDRSGGGTASWYRETRLPHDIFDTESLLSDRWEFSGDADDYTLSQGSGVIALGVEKSEGVASVSSDGKWRLSGDFDIRLYIDWSSYYNEYRSITHSFFKVGVDSENAARISFSFNGVDGFEFASEKTVGRNLIFFDWKDNGSPRAVGNIAAAQAFDYLRITRTAGIVRTYIVNGASIEQVGDDITDAVFSDDVFVEFGVEAKEYNTTRTSYTRFFVAEGATSEVIEFFSSARGRRQDFPERCVITVDPGSLSIIDETQERLWGRVLLDDDSLFPDSNIKVSACNGAIHCATSAGLVSFDFVRDTIYKYSGSSILESVEPMALRNASITFDTFGTPGTFQSSAFNDVSCRTIGSEDFIALASDAGVTVIRALSSGIAYSTNGPLPVNRVKISEANRLWWSGYDADNNEGELSVFNALPSLTTNTAFSRDTYYGVDTALPIFGSHIQAFDVRTQADSDLIAVGTTEGITFIGFSPAVIITRSVSFGVVAPADNPFSDPSFENYIGLDWKPFNEGGLHETFRIYRSNVFSTDGDYSLRLRFTDAGLYREYQENHRFGVYQDVDLTNVSTIYFDCNLVRGAADDVWAFEMLVDDTVIKTFNNGDGSFTRINDFAPVPAGTEGVHRVTIQLRMRADNRGDEIDQSSLYIDNLKTKIGDPDYRILPAGAASVDEVLLQFDSSGHKIYFSTLAGYGAIDLDDESLDYFVPITGRLPDSSIQTADFSRIDDDV